MRPPETPEVLVIEDDTDTRDLLVDTLGVSGFRVSVASSGPQGLEFLRENTPEIVVLDQLLPGMSGLEVCRAIRRQPALSAVPVVMLTALNRPSDQVAGLEAGADDYVIKPFNVDELTARLHSHVRRSRRERQLNPLTGLPGNLAIDGAIDDRLVAREPFAVAWIDLDNFKSYNDRYGYYAGDRVIAALGRLLIQVVERCGQDASFAGHIGGDDFVLVMPIDEMERAGRLLAESFDAGVLAFYRAEDRERGFVPAISRTGDERAFPLMSVSVAIVPCPVGRFAHPGEISEVAGQIKRFLKERRMWGAGGEGARLPVSGSAWLVDRRDAAPVVGTEIRPDRA